MALRNGIKEGRTVVSRKGHSEFLNLRANLNAGPGDVVKLKRAGAVDLEIAWSAVDETSGIIEVVQNGKVVASKRGVVHPDIPVILKTEVEFTSSGWVCARRMDADGHVTHTAPLYVSLDNKPIRASAEDASFFVAWIDNILKNIRPGQPWERYFTKEPELVRQRYLKARSIYQQIEKEALENAKR
jgi:hypothetical protein